MVTLKEQLLFKFKTVTFLKYFKNWTSTFLSRRPSRGDISIMARFGFDFNGMNYKSK